MSSLRVTLSLSTERRLNGIEQQTLVDWLAQHTHRTPFLGALLFVFTGVSCHKQNWKPLVDLSQAVLSSKPSIPGMRV